MNQVDRMVKQSMLAYPTLFPSRFAAFSEMMVSSCCDWDARGQLVRTVHDDAERNATVESAIEKMVERLDHRKAERTKNLKEFPDSSCRSLYDGWVVDAELELIVVRHKALHIDLYASEWIGGGTEETSSWIQTAERRGIHSSPYGAVNNKPANIDEEWRLAVKSWCHQFIPTMNGLWGIHDDETGWHGRPEHKDFFDWAYRMLRLYTSDEERERHNRMAEELRKLIKKEDTNGA